MATIKNVICYQYAQTAEKIRHLKTETYKATEHDKYYNEQEVSNETSIDQFHHGRLDGTSQ